MAQTLNSIPVASANAQFFRDILVDKTYKDYVDVDYQPISAITADTQQIDFDIPKSPNLIDPSQIFLRVTFKVQKKGTAALENLAAADKLNLSQYALHALFKSVDLTLNDTKVTPATDQYHMLSFIEAMVKTTKEEKDTILSAAGWNDETARENLIKQSKSVTMQGRLHLPFFRQDMLLIPNVGMRLTFSRARDEHMFYGVTDAAKDTLNPVVVIEKAHLYVRHYTPNDEMINALEHQLLEGRSVPYFINNTEVKGINIASGQNQVSIESVIKGQLPRRWLIGFLPNTAFTGDKQVNTFDFGNHTITTIGASVDGRPVPLKRYEPVWSDPKQGFVREYIELYRCFAQDEIRPLMNVSLSDFKDHFCMFPFNIDPTFSNGPQTGVTPEVKFGTVRIDVTFGTAPASTLTMIVFSEYSNVIEIDAMRKVTTDY